MLKRLLVFAVVAAAVLHNAAPRAEVIAFDSDRWQITAVESELEEHLGRHSLMLKGGIAYIQGAEVTDGTIEFDISFSGERGFMGAVWRLVDTQNHEQFYVRPHQSGMPDASQYTPVFNGVSGWQLYHGEGFGAPMTFPFDQWLHIKIVVGGQQATVYVDDGESPVLSIAQLKRPVESGSVGLFAGNFAPAYFSNFSFEALTEVSSNSVGDEPVTVAEGMVATWLISDTFAEGVLDGVTAFDEPRQPIAGWTELASEASGMANIARVAAHGADHNTVFARIVVVSDKAQVKCIQLGYSDRARVFLNDRLLYEGDNTYQTRDYRYLGTIGLFDSVCLQLNEGPNELWVAVSESFGGWGIMAQFLDMDGIEVQSSE